MNTIGKTAPSAIGRGSLPIVAVLIASILGTGITGSLCIGQRERLERRRGITVNHSANLSNLNSFALGLLLGGLRGPLVMMLWTSSENQKTEKNLEDFDTKVELIRLLQPEFDTVHLFQIWNKAYNISVQMSNIASKYTTILDALDYADSVNREHPDDINIIAAIGGLYFDKFGGSTEKFYFSPRLRDESRQDEQFVHVIFAADKLETVADAARLSGAPAYSTLLPRDANTGGSSDGSKLMLVVRKSVADDLSGRLPRGVATFEPQPIHTVLRHDAAGRRLEQDTVLDAAGNLLPQFTAPRSGRPAVGDASDESELPYLPQFEPYPYGVSPYAFAFSYFKRCQWMQANRGAVHAQMAARVLSSRPALALEKWSEEDWYNGLRGEIELSGQVPGEDADLQSPTQARVLSDTFQNCPLLTQTIAHFERASKIAAAAADEYLVHIKEYPADELTYRSHIRDVQARSQLTAGDALYLRAMLATGDQRKQLAVQAREHYLLAANLYTRLFLRYFMGEEDVKVVLPQDLRKLKRIDVDAESGKLRDDELAGTLERLKARYAANRASNGEDFQEIDNYIERAYARLRSLATVR